MQRVVFGERNWPQMWVGSVWGGRGLANTCQSNFSDHKTLFASCRRYLLHGCVLFRRCVRHSSIPGVSPVSAIVCASYRQRNTGDRGIIEEFSTYGGDHGPKTLDACGNEDTFIRDWSETLAFEEQSRHAPIET